MVIDINSKNYFFSNLNLISKLVINEIKNRKEIIFLNNYLELFITFKKIIHIKMG